MSGEGDIVTILKIVTKVVLAARIDQRVDKEKTHGKLSKCLLKMPILVSDTHGLVGLREELHFFKLISRYSIDSEVYFP